ncbi:hypothetical protein REPUB_Repub16aG0130200 [Reevesia pubescens]
MFFEERLSSSKKEKKSRGSRASSDAGKKLREEACRQMLLKVRTHVLPIKMKGARSKSVLLDGCRMASALDKVSS